MSRGRFGFLVVVAFVGSIIGGALSGWWLAPSSIKGRRPTG